MPKGKIEHANLTVTQPERSARLFKTLLGWEERWRGASKMGGETIHVGEQGNGGSYMALYTIRTSQVAMPRASRSTMSA